MLNAASVFTRADFVNADVLPFGRLWYAGPNAAANALGYAMHHSRSHPAVIRVYDDTGNVIEAHEGQSQP